MQISFFELPNLFLDWRNKIKLLFLAFETFNEKKKKFIIKCYYFNRYISPYFNETKKNKLFFTLLIAKHCWVINLGEFKSDRKYFAW